MCEIKNNFKLEQEPHSLSCSFKVTDLKHSSSCVLCFSSTLSSFYRSKNIRRAWLIGLVLYLDLFSSCELHYSNNKAWHHKQASETAVLASFKLPMGSLSGWPARCWILISGLSLAKALRNKCFLKT